MTTIERATLSLVNLTPPVRPVDAIQSSVSRETPVLRLQCSDGSEGVRYTYTIGAGGSSVVALLSDHLLPRLIGQDPERIEGIWQDLPCRSRAAPRASTGL
jgi:L-alanine-DL-glutamate epimerase-like enolase superfamily enzyme